MSFEGSSIVVTGGSGDIGRLVVEELTKAGASVVVVRRKVPEAGIAGGDEGDLSTQEGILATASRIAAIAPDILINLAGSQYFGPFVQQEQGDTHKAYMVNLIAPVLLSQAVLPAMQARSAGQIVNVGSIFGSINYPHFVTYSSAKAGLHGFSLGLRRELHGSGVGVTYIAPRAVRTRLHHAMVRRFCEMANMKLDEPAFVARRIVQAISRRKKDVYIGAAEKIFVKLNALVPSLVDAALAKQTIKARELFY